MVILLLAFWLIVIVGVIAASFSNKPERPKRVLYGAGWMAPVANSTYYEELADYEEAMAEREDEAARERIEMEQLREQYEAHIRQAKLPHVETYRPPQRRTFSPPRET